MAPSDPEPQAHRAAPATASGPVSTRRQRLWAWLGEVARFCSVGLVAYVVDVGLMNLLRFGPGEVLGHKPLTAKVISVSVAILIAWWGNRNWTFARRRSAPTATARSRELVQFIAVNLVGMAIGVGCLAVSHYLLGFTSPLADNISANGVGLVLGTVFRYVAYRYWVFTADGGDAPPPPGHREEAPHRDPAASEPR